MRVIVANYRYFISGGPDRYMFNFMQAAMKYDIEVIPFSVQDPKNTPSQYESYFAKPRAENNNYQKNHRNKIGNLLGYSRAVIWNFEAEKKLITLIKDVKPDVLYVLHQINHLSPSIIKAAKSEGVKIVHRISDFFMFCARYDFLRDNKICELCKGANLYNAVKFKCVKQSYACSILRVIAMKLHNIVGVYGHVDYFITPSKFTLEIYKNEGIEEHRIIHIPTFTNVDEVIPSYTNNNYFLYLGRIAEQKGLIHLVEAMKYFKASRHKLVITGCLSDSDYDQKIRVIIDKHQLQEKIEFIGFKNGNELSRVISDSICIINPAIWYENMPNSVIESYAHGKPVIGTNIGSMSEIINHGVTGYLVEPNDVESLSHYMKKVVDCEERLVRLGRNARRKCENEFSIGMHMQRVIEVFNQIHVSPIIS